MNGSQQNLTERQKILAAMQIPPADGYFVWDGESEDDRPLNREEMLAGMAKFNDSNKTEVALQIDNDVVTSFRAMGKDWKNCINIALKEWLQEHSVAVP